MSFLEECLQIKLDQLTQHTLIVGTTGSGKTQTTLNVIHDLWENYKIPFLVIESAKREYRGLIGVERLWDSTPLRVYTVGDETVSPIRINPFELLPHVRVEDHVRFLTSCFQAALPSDIGSLPSILERAIRKTYYNKGWYYNCIRTMQHPATFPTMQDFVEEVETLIDEEYSKNSRVRDDILSVLSVRLRPFIDGSKGYLLNTEHSSPEIGLLFENPVILEMDSLHASDKALVSLFLLTFLREYCRTQIDAQKTVHGLRHVTLVEEAHNLLAQVGSATSETASNARYEAVVAFCNLLAEIRSYGEGIIIVDQRPSKLASDALANTNIKIVHRLVEKVDRDVIWNSVVVIDDDASQIAKLRSGECKIFHMGTEYLVKKKIPLYSGESGIGAGYVSTLSDADLKQYLTMKGILQVPYADKGCLQCGSVCKYMSLSKRFVEENEKDIDFRKEEEFWLQKFCDKLDNILTNTQHSTSTKVFQFEEMGTVDVPWCIFVHTLVRKKLTPSLEQIKGFRVYFEQRYAKRLGRG